MACWYCPLPSSMCNGHACGPKSKIIIANYINIVHYNEKLDGSINLWIGKFLICFGHQSKSQEVHNILYGGTPFAIQVQSWYVPSEDMKNIGFLTYNVGNEILISLTNRIKNHSKQNQKTRFWKSTTLFSFLNFFLGDC